MSWALNNVTAPDNYTAAATIDNLPFATRINLDVFNQGIYWQLKQAIGTGLSTEGTWGQEVYMGPGSRSLYRSHIIGVRVRAAVAAANLPQGTTPAQVTVEAVE